MRFSTTILFAALAGVAMAEWDKYADERSQAVDPSEPTSQDAEWEEAHGGPAPTYAANADWMNDAVTGAIKAEAESVQTDLPPSPAPNSENDDAGTFKWTNEKLDALLNRRDEPGDPDSDEWAQENGYLPLGRRDELTPDEVTNDGDVEADDSLSRRDEDPDSAEFAIANGYSPLGKRDEPVDPESDGFAAANGYSSLDRRELDPDSDEFAVANGYSPLDKRDVSTDPESDEFAKANGYAPLSKRDETLATKTTRSALYDWVMRLGGRRTRPTHFLE